MLEGTAQSGILVMVDGTVPALGQDGAVVLAGMTVAEVGIP